MTLKISADIRTLIDEHGAQLVAITFFSSPVCAIKKRSVWAVGAVCTDFVEFRKKTPQKFYKYFDEALTAVQESLRHNVGKNIRLEAASYLRLTRLCLLNGNTTILGFENFEKWTKLESKVEHAYLRKWLPG